MIEDRIVSALESLLFLSGEPVPRVRLARALGVTEKEAQEALEILGKSYRESTLRGLMLVEDEKSVVLVTKPDNALLLETFTKSTREENMSKAALEVLAIVAYRAPVSRTEIDALRGVNCSFTLRNLLLRDLITREGNPGDSRGYLYRPTLKLLETLGVHTIAELPDFEVLSQDERLQRVLEEVSTTDEGDGQTTDSKEE